MFLSTVFLIFDPLIRAFIPSCHEKTGINRNVLGSNVYTVQFSFRPFESGTAAHGFLTFIAFTSFLMITPNEILKLRRRFRRTKKQPGVPPGTLVYGGEKAAGPVRVQIYDYDAKHLEEVELTHLEVCASYRDRDTVTWINVDGVHDTEVISRIGEMFDIHPLTLEDIVSTNQRPKMEEYPSYVYVVVQMLHYDHQTALLEAEQVSIVFGEGFLISFQEANQGDVFDPVRKRLRENRGFIRTAGADYLAYSLLDVIVDFYMDILENLGEHMESLEDLVTTDPRPEVMRQINQMRHRVVFLRRSIWPLRDVITALERSDLPFITPETDLFFRDVYDHTVRTVEMIEAEREILASLTDLYISTLSHRMNEIMKILTAIATFFLPLTFIAGIYGMNFDPDTSPLNMPELRWFYGYPFSLALMALVALSMYIFFRRKGWL